MKGKLKLFNTAQYLLKIGNELKYYENLKNVLKGIIDVLFKFNYSSINDLNMLKVESYNKLR